MKNASKPQLGPMPEIGQHVVVVVVGPPNTYVCPGRVAKTGRRLSVKLYASADRSVVFGNRSLLRRDEGVTWARGWDTEEANALRVSEALR